MQHTYIYIIYSAFIIVIAFYCAEFFNAAYTIMHMYIHYSAQSKPPRGGIVREKRIRCSRELYYCPESSEITREVQ